MILESQICDPEINITEIFLSLQGESSWAGLPTIFVRCCGCDLRCSYCDTTYAYSGGVKLHLREVLAKIMGLVLSWKKNLASQLSGCEPYILRNGKQIRLPIIEVTGGEPMIQSGTKTLLTELSNTGYQVLLETNGAHDISKLDERVIRIVDVKCPSSGETSKVFWKNLDFLRPNDELKFVIATREDFYWARDVIYSKKLWEKCALLVSWARIPERNLTLTDQKKIPSDHTLISCEELADLVLQEGLPVRFQVQLQKVIWTNRDRGV
jgi:7-carboxy-7-deazaguanine synthase